MQYHKEAPERERVLKRASLLLLAAAFALIAVAALSPGGSDAASSGECGDSLVWELSGGHLTISGSGPMYDFGEEGGPWGQNIDTVLSSIKLVFDQPTVTTSIEICLFFISIPLL